jgi:hypothetical protein
MQIQAGNSRLDAFFAMRDAAVARNSVPVSRGPALAKTNTGSTNVLPPLTNTTRSLDPQLVAQATIKGPTKGRQIDFMA